MGSYAARVVLRLARRPRRPRSRGGRRSLCARRRVSTTAVLARTEGEGVSFLEKESGRKALAHHASRLSPSLSAIHARSVSKARALGNGSCTDRIARAEDVQRAMRRERRTRGSAALLAARKAWSARRRVLHSTHARSRKTAPDVLRVYIAGADGAAAVGCMVDLVRFSSTLRAFFSALRRIRMAGDLARADPPRWSHSGVSIGEAAPRRGLRTSR